MSDLQKTKILIVDDLAEKLLVYQVILQELGQEQGGVGILGVEFERPVKVLQRPLGAAEAGPPTGRVLLQDVRHADHPTAEKTTPPRGMCFCPFV